MTELDDLRAAVREFLRGRIAQRYRAPTHGHRDGLRRGRVAPNGLRARPSRHRRARGVGRSRRGHVRTGRRLRRDGRRAAVLAVLLDRRIGHSGHSDQRRPRRDGGIPADIRRRHLHCDADPQRATERLGRRRGDVDRDARRRRLSGHRAMRRWCSTATLPTSCSSWPTPRPAHLCSRSPRIPPESSASHSQAWTALARSRAFGSTAHPAGSSEPTATRRRDWPARRTSRWWRWPQSRSERRSAASTWRWATPRTASSSAGPSEASRRSSTGARTCWCWSKGRARPSYTPRRWPTALTWQRRRRWPKWPVRKPFCRSALDNMRIHGGIGFTWEHDAHLYVRRAKTTELIFGSPDYHAQRLADLVSYLKGPS